MKAKIAMFVGKNLLLKMSVILGVYSKVTPVCSFEGFKCLRGKLPIQGKLERWDFICTAVVVTIIIKNGNDSEVFSK